jgi:hypothetical protein
MSLNFSADHFQPFWGGAGWAPKAMHGWRAPPARACKYELVRHDCMHARAVRARGAGADAQVPTAVLNLVRSR